MPNTQFSKPSEAKEKEKKAPNQREKNLPLYGR